MTGPEVQAAVVSTALRGFPLSPSPAGWNTLLAVLLAVVAPFVALRFGAGKALLAGLVAVLAFLVAAQLAFNGGAILAVVPPLAGAFVGPDGDAVRREPAPLAGAQPRARPADRARAATSAPAGCARCCCSARRSRSWP